MRQGDVVHTGSWVEALVAIAPLVLLTLWMLWLLHYANYPQGSRHGHSSHRHAAGDDPSSQGEPPLRE